MNHFRLRGTWEDDPAPIPFPGADARRGPSAGRHAGVDDAPRSTDPVIRGIDAEFDRISFKIDELRDMLLPTMDDDSPDAA